MARGVMYYISKDMHEDVSFDESLYYDRLDAFGVDFIENESEEESKQSIEFLEEMMFRLGAVTGREHDLGDFKVSFCQAGL